MTGHILARAGIAALSFAAVGLTACDPPHPHWRDRAALKTISMLDCPQSQGDLTRKSAAADGKSCLYASDGGAQVTLQLISLDGKEAKAALAPLEASLKSELPTPPAGPAAAAATGGDHDRVDINLPGIHIHANGDGHADVAAAGVNVHADDNSAHVESGAGRRGVTVDADEGGAQVRVDEAGAGVRLSYILASESAGPHGWRMAGYEARGPAAGPLAVVSVLAKDEDHDHLHHDIRALLRRNVGG